MNRLAVPAGALQPGRVALPDEAARKARLVLRLREGDEVELFDGAGRRALARIAAGEGEGVFAEVAEVQTVAAGARIAIAQALCKGDKMELVIQKATELGASCIVPYASERAVVKLDAKKGAERVDRWQKIAAEAARQCGRSDVPEVAPLTDLAGVLARPGARAVLYEEERGHRFADFLDGAGDEATLLIGPEGGFAPHEIERARSAGAAVVTLGSRILRTETVALAALAIALHRRGELG